MNIVDIVIIILILMGGIVGFKRGFTTEIVKAIGFILVLVLAFLFKNPVSIFMYENLPFLNIGFLKGAAILNILLYEILAFVLMLIIFSVILKIILLATSVFEKFLNATVILGIPSKIAGAIIGIIHDYIIVFIILYIITILGINLNVVENSKLRSKIVNETPFLSGLVDKSLNVVDEFKDLKTDYDNKTISQSEFDARGLDLFLKYKIITPESAKKLYEKKKLPIFHSSNEIIDKYKEA